MSAEAEKILEEFNKITKDHFMSVREGAIKFAEYYHQHRLSLMTDEKIKEIIHDRPPYKMHSEMARILKKNQIAGAISIRDHLKKEL